MIELEQAKSKLDQDAQVLVTCVPVTKIVTVTQISSSSLPMNLIWRSLSPIRLQKSCPFLNPPIRWFFLPNHSKKIQFSLLNAQDTVKISEFEVTHRDLYTPTDRLPVKNGVLDRRLVCFVLLVFASDLFVTLKGTTDKGAFCETCGQSSVNCVGHYAYIKLVVPVFHIGYFKHTISVLQAICKVRVVVHPALPGQAHICNRHVPASFSRKLIGAYSSNGFVAQI